MILLDIPQVVYRKDIYTIGTFADVEKESEASGESIRIAMIAGTCSYVHNVNVLHVGETRGEGETGYCGLNLIPLTVSVRLWML